MRIITVAAIWLATTVLATRALGHGNSIQVNVNGSNQLMVANGLPLTGGFASLASDPHEDAALDDAPNQKLRSSFPGYDVAGLAPSAALQMEILGRPDCTTPGHPTRWLWFWDPATQEVATPTGDPRFEVIPIFGSGRIQVQQSTMNLGPTLTMADPIGPFLGADQHLLIYELQNSPQAQLGVYAIFARLASPGLQPSEPFLLVFRNIVSADLFDDAADAINQAAGLAGDFNHDCVVDAEDYVVWRKATGTAAEYEAWRSNFGQAIPHPGMASLAHAAVPEPAAMLLVLNGLFIVWTSRSQRRLQSADCSTW